MAALIVPLGLVRRAVNQSARIGIDESRCDVIDRILDDLRTTDHPTARAVREADAQPNEASNATRG